MKRRTSQVAAIALLLPLLAILLAACGSGGEKPSAPAKADPSAIQQVDGRAVSATEAQLVLRTADRERTFQIQPEDLAAVDPGHFSSHVGIPTLGFRIFFRSEGGVEYAVSAEEIAGSGLGFD